MRVIFFGIVILFSLLHPLNAPGEILLIHFGKRISVIFPFPAKAFSPITSTKAVFPNLFTASLGIFIMRSSVLPIDISSKGLFVGNGQPTYEPHRRKAV